jgi:2-polyprenyl-6-methoxyphenol hydroxylase-like FAD-dependent oxidoreductase
MSRRFDALIVGAGVAGSACAILLARCGWNVALVERQVFPRAKVCGECLGASSFALLDTLGVGAAVRAAAGPELQQVQLLRGAHSVSAALPPARRGGGDGGTGDGAGAGAGSGAQDAWSRAVGREVLDTLLLEQAVACGVTLWQPWAVQGIAGEVGNWRCSLRAPSTQEQVTLRAEVLIDAHGSWEPLAALQAQRPQRTVRAPPPAASQLFAFKAHFQHSRLEAGTLAVLLLQGGYGGLVQGADGQATLACCIRRDRLNALRSHYPATSAGASVQAMLQQQCLGVQQALHEAERVGPWLAAGPLVTGMHLRPQDTVLRLGNAAGEAHPLIGEGMSMALQSAWLLSHTLQAQRSRARTGVRAWHSLVATEYAAQWSRLLQPRLRTAAVFAHLAMHRAAAPALLALLQAQPGLLTRAARWAGKADGFAPMDKLRATPGTPATPVTPTRPIDPRSNNNAHHTGHTAKNPDQGLPTGA